jgi:hypothetical protein
MLSSSGPFYLAQILMWSLEINDISRYVRRHGKSLLCLNVFTGFINLEGLHFCKIDHSLYRIRKRLASHTGDSIQSPFVNHSFRFFQKVGSRENSLDLNDQDN